MISNKILIGTLVGTIIGGGLFISMDFSINESENDDFQLDIMTFVGCFIGASIGFILGTCCSSNSEENLERDEVYREFFESQSMIATNQPENEERPLLQDGDIATINAERNLPNINNVGSANYYTIV